MSLDFWIDPWRSTTQVQMVMAAALTTLACGLPGTFLVLRRMSLTGDAISHSVLPGIVLGFLVSGSLDSPWLVAGAAAFGWFTVMGIGLLNRRGGVREDAATGIVFTAMFSIGVVLLRLFASKVDLDPDCVLFGNLETAIHGNRVTFMGFEIPSILATSGGAALLAVILVAAIYHRLLCTSFDPSLATLTKQSPGTTQSLLLALVAAIVVASFQIVGAVMSVALLVLPAATALQLSGSLPTVLKIVALHALLSAVAGLYLASYFDCNLGAAVVLCGAGWFVIAAISRGFIKRAA